MNKKDFKKTMEELKLLIEDSNNVNKAMKRLSPDFGGFYNERAETLILKVLKIVTKDSNDWIGHYIYELDWGKKYKAGCITDKDKKNVKLKTLDDLYSIIKTI